MIIGRNIRTLRKKNGVSQKALSEGICIPQQTISCWEIERNEPTIYSCVLIADFFDISLDELCRGEIK
jgi:transcriptional regulator with XRE-family HTH domain